MIMSVEKIRNSNNTLVFSEAAAPLIFAGLKLATTKLVELDPVTCSPGDVLTAECGEKNSFPVVILDVADLKLEEISLPRLSLGSFISYDEATDKLGSFFQKKVDMETLVRHYVFIPKDKFDSLPEKVRSILVENSIEDLMRMQELKEIFYPSMAHWLAVKLDYSVSEWIEFLNLFLLINVAGNIEEADQNAQLTDLLKNKDSELYRQIVLGSTK